MLQVAGCRLQVAVSVLQVADLANGRPCRLQVAVSVLGLKTLQVVELADDKAAYRLQAAGCRSQVAGYKLTIIIDLTKLSDRH